MGKAGEDVPALLVRSEPELPARGHKGPSNRLVVRVADVRPYEGEYEEQDEEGDTKHEQGIAPHICASRMRGSRTGSMMSTRRLMMMNIAPVIRMQACI